MHQHIGEVVPFRVELPDRVVHHEGQRQKRSVEVALASTGMMEVRLEDGRDVARASDVFVDLDGADIVPDELVRERVAVSYQPQKTNE